MSVVLLAAAIAGGAALTYLVDELEDGLLGRLAVGVPVGLIVLGHAGFLAASAVGMGAAVAAGAVAVLAPLTAVAVAPGRRAKLVADLEAVGPSLAASLRSAGGLAQLAALGAGAALCWRIFQRAMFEDGGAILTGVDHNLGDLPFHVSIVTSFLYGENFPPEHPELAGARLTYPFLVDFVTAMLMKAGAGLGAALFMENVVLAWAVLVLLRRLFREMTGDGAAALLAVAIVLFSGGLGFALLKDSVSPLEGGLMGWLARPAHDLTITGSGPYRWGNVVVTMLMPQRSFLLGLPAFLVVATLWWRATGDLSAPQPDAARARRRLLAAGLLTGALPLVHAHACAIALAVAAALALLFPSRAWLRFFAAAGPLAAPQVALAASGTALRAGSFLGLHLGWDRGSVPVAWFWLLNLGAFVPMLVVALAWRGPRPLLSRRLLRFYAPFLFCFLAPNVLRLSPWLWDNVKFMVFWHVASAALVALALRRLWDLGAGRRALSSLLFAILVLAGAHDVYRVAAGTIANAVFSAPAVAFGRTLREVTPPRAIVLNAPTYNSEVYLAGRRSVLGYTGHIWSQGLDPGTRDEDVRRIYAGGPDRDALLRKHGVEFVLLGPRERVELGADEAAFAGLPLVARSEEHHLYRAAP